MQMIDLVPDLRPTILAARELRDARNQLSTFLPNTAVDAVSYRHGRRKRLDQAVPVRAIDAPATPERVLWGCEQMRELSVAAAARCEEAHSHE